MREITIRLRVKDRKKALAGKERTMQSADISQVKSEPSVGQTPRTKLPGQNPPLHNLSDYFH